jgi:hypothetical protein
MFCSLPEMFGACLQTFLPEPLQGFTAC